jgi:hypothetical protein
MSGTPINGANYPTLFTYAVLSANDLNSGTGSNTINGGHYGYANSLSGTGTITGTANSSNVSLALAELGDASSGAGTLVYDILNNGFPNETLNAQYNDTSVTFYGNKNYVASGAVDFNAISVSITLTFDAQGNSNAQFFIIVPETIHFSGNYSLTMVLQNGALASNIFWLAQGNTPTGGILWSNTIGSHTYYGTYISLVDEIGLNNQGSTIDGNLFLASGSSSQINLEGNGSIVNGQGGPVVCFLKGTKILTQRGHIAIENIQISDRVVTKGKILNNETLANDNFKLEPIVWVSNFNVPKLNVDSYPICIKQNALGPNRPFEDLYVSPNHGIIINGKLVPAKNLANGITIYQDCSKDSITYYHLELKKHSAIVANGVLSESFLDLNNKYAFNYSETIDQLGKTEIIGKKSCDPDKLLSVLKQMATKKNNRKGKKQQSVLQISR